MEMNMNTGMDNWAKQLEELANESSEQDFGGMSLDEISVQLFAQNPKYEKVTGDLMAGNPPNIDDVKDLKKTLADFSNILHKESKSTAEWVRLSEIVKKRIQTLDKLIKTTNSSH